MEKEIWKDIKGYEGLYQVSNLGRVRSLDRYVFNGLTYYFKKGRIIKSSYSRGYLKIELSKNGKQETKPIHRLVAEAFIPNPNNYPCINHKNEKRDDNRVENLEWCTYNYNNNYGTRNRQISDKIKGEKNPMYGKHLTEEQLEKRREKTINGKLSKAVLQIGENTNKIIAEFPSIKEVERQLGYFHSNISKCCNGKIKSAYGYKWSFK